MNLSYTLIVIAQIVWFIAFAGACYRFREIPHIWSVSTTFKMNKKFNKRWLTDASPRKDSKIRDMFGVNTFDDGYHFFGNLPRIVLSLMLFANTWYLFDIYYGLLFGFSAFFFWWLTNDLALRIILEDY